MGLETRLAKLEYHHKKEPKKNSMDNMTSEERKARLNELKDKLFEGMGKHEIKKSHIEFLDKHPEIVKEFERKYGYQFISEVSVWD